MSTTTRDDRGTWSARLTWLVPALLTYVPLLLTQPGWIGADTKSYLYLDPAKLLADAPYAWDSQVGMGTVTHQNIGYLFPMGPYYLFFDRLGVPDWVAQRLWLATVIFLAGMGVRYLLRTIRIGGRSLSNEAILVASLAYMFSPYLLAYAARISVILLPWTALPWLIALTARALRNGGWWYPSAFALVVLAVGGINATALLLVGVGPLLWLVHAVLVDREATARQAWGVVWRIGLLTTLTALWWIAGLWAEGRYGLPVIRYTETYRAVAGASNAPEVLRGLGYWFFYGGDKLGPWIEPSELYTTNVAMLALTYALPVAALAVAAVLRWRYRLYFGLLVLSGTLIAVAGHPWEASPVLGGVFKELTRTNAGLSLRSTPRAVPLVALGTAVFLGAGIGAVARQRPRLRVPATAVAAVAVYAAMAPLWTGHMVAEHLRRPEDPATPEARYDYWSDAAAWLEARDPETRIFEVPGSDFASYIWGNTVDPITPGLTDRAYVARELFQWGSPQSAAYLEAIDRRMQEGLAEPEAVAPIARTFAVGDILLRADLKFERFRTPRPKQMWDLLTQAPGLDAPVAFAEALPVIAGPEQPLVDELELGQPPDLLDPPLLSAFGVQDPLPIFRTQPVPAPLLVAGDADGLVGAAGAGLLDPVQATFLSAGYATDAAGLDALVDEDAQLLVTDTNRRRAHRWGALRETTGYTERAGEVPEVYDPSDQRLDVFPGAGDDAFTVTEHHGATVTATAYGNPITYTPEDRPAMAFDGDPATAWRVGAIDDPTGEQLRIELDAPVTTDHVSVVQPLSNVRNRWVTRIAVRLDDGDPIEVDLDQSSRELPGQAVTFPEQSFSKLTVELLADDVGPRPRYDGLSGVGFAEVTIPGVTFQEVVRPPTDLLDAVGADSADHALGYQFERLRANPLEPVRADPESAMRRIVDVPTDRAFSVEGTARLATAFADDDLDRLLGLPDARHGGVTATSSARLPSIRARASAAFDGDPTTAWTSIYDKQEGHWLGLDLPEPVTFDHIGLDVLADFVHSVPTRLRIEADGQQVAVVDLPPAESVFDRGHLVHLDVPTPSITGRSLRFIIDDVDEMATIDWYTDRPITLPVGIAELQVADVRTQQPGAWFDSGCRSDLLAVDGTPVPVRIEGPTEQALDLEGLPVHACGTDGLDLAAGAHVLDAAPGRSTGIDLDRLVLRSDAGGAPAAPIEQRTPPRADTPPVTVASQGRTSFALDVPAGDEPFWLTFSQSWNPGWSASVGGTTLGPPTVINGYANGWLVDPRALGVAPGDTVHVEVAWTPQRAIWIALGISVAAVVACLALLLFARRRARPGPDPSGAPVAARWDLGTTSPVLRRPPWWPGATRDTDGPGDGRGGARPAIAAAAGVLAALATALNVPTTVPTLLTAVPVGIGVAAAWRWRRGRGVLGAAAAACLGLAGAYYVVWQVRFDFPADFVWPQLFERVHVLGVLAVLLLAAEVLREPAVAARPSTEPGG